MVMCFTSLRPTNSISTITKTSENNIRVLLLNTTLITADNINNENNPYRPIPASCVNKPMFIGSFTLNCTSYIQRNGTQMEMGHLSWPMTHVTHHTVDPWPTWPMAVTLFRPAHGTRRGRGMVVLDNPVGFESKQNGGLKLSLPIWWWD